MKKVLLIIMILAAIGTGFYFYAYHGHRDIASEEADFTITVAQLSDAFAKDASTKKYDDRTLLITGKVTGVDAAAKTVTIDNSLTASFAEMPDVEEGSTLTLKARFVGYDDLLGEFRTDQASIPE